VYPLLKIMGGKKPIKNTVGLRMGYKVAGKGRKEEKESDNCRLDQAQGSF
jgi:hypothetical protein